MKTDLNARMTEWVKTSSKHAHLLQDFKKGSEYLARVKAALGSQPELQPSHITAFTHQTTQIKSGDRLGFYQWAWGTAENGIASVERTALPPDALEDILKHVDCQGFTFHKINALLLQNSTNYEIVLQWLAGWKLRNIGYDWAKVPKACVNRLMIGTRPDLFANIVSDAQLRELCDEVGLSYTDDASWADLNMRLVKKTGELSSTDPDAVFKRSLALGEIR